MAAAQLALDFAPPRPRQVETPAARRTDPKTSHLAADQITASGKRGQQQAQAIAAVRAFPGMTSFELAMRTNLDRYMLARRLPECVTAGSVRKDEPRTCSITGRLATTWFPT
ncbi:winged helix-turn-helix domain-containing protein [Luteibacter sp.]|uniref:winged helix-turn-helix domain-containing protein n=1 Tax=Luteibacter sp. TaxID=1886636 RepID=UPI0025BAF514|nr:winged helix-turn-helix domain-containing protein [Luteibacter sp.]